MIVRDLIEDVSDNQTEEVKEESVKKQEDRTSVVLREEKIIMSANEHLVFGCAKDITYRKDKQVKE